MRFLSVFVGLAFLINSALPVPVLAQEGILLSNVPLASATNVTYYPVQLKALNVRPDQPLVFDFIVDSGNSGLTGNGLKAETERLAKYFLAAVTIPEKDLWVNLSPYEKDRVIPDELGRTELGRVMLAQDSALKQLASSLLDPKSPSGKLFWDRVYAEARATFGSVDIPLETLNKVWIVPNKAVIYEKDNAAVLGTLSMSVMMDEDYQGMAAGANASAVAGNDPARALSLRVMREVALPMIENEVNTGKAFAELRQIYGAMVLATWYKMSLKDGLLAQVYADQKKVAGVETPERDMRDIIYEQYLEQFRRGSFNLIYEDQDPSNGDILPRKYFSGGEQFNNLRGKAQRIDLAEEHQDESIGTLTSATIALDFSQKDMTPKTIVPQTAVSDNSRAKLLKLNVSEVLKENILAGVVQTEEQAGALQALIDIGEEEMFAQWDAPSINDDRKRRFLEQIYLLNEGYPGGLRRYKRNVRALLKASATGENPFKGLIPKVPSGVNIRLGDGRLGKLSALGLKAINKTIFVLVAGGLGERLGYSGGIKIGIPQDLVTGRTYLENYIRSILALQNESNRLNHEERKIPLVIMTSDDTHAATVELLERNNFFGMDGVSVNPDKESVLRGEAKQIIVLKQGLVPAVKDNDARFILDIADSYKLQAKPHGHGDVHMLLARAGIVERGIQEGRTHTFFIQDTNGQVMNAVLPSLGNSVENSYDMNFVTVPREAGEAAGAIMAMESLDHGKSITQNTEYNEISRVLPEGDLPDPNTGKSPFPGNTNIFVLENRSYQTALDTTSGIFGEFINPKYADKTNTVFTKPARAETMMQDYAKFLPGNKVGVTNFLDKLFAFAPVKNNLTSGANLVEQGNNPDVMSTGEFALYLTGLDWMKMGGTQIADPRVNPIRGIPLKDGAKIVFTGGFVLSSEDVFNKIKGGKLSAHSVLWVEGRDVRLERLELDGTLIVKVAPEASLVIEDVVMKNRGWNIAPLSDEEMQEGSEVPQYLKIRGYRLKKIEQLVIDITTPGKYEFRNDGKLYREEGGLWVEFSDGVRTTFDAADNLGDDAIQGGIDFNAARLNMQIERTGDGVKVTADPAMVEQIRSQGVDGFAPVIINMMPVSNINAVFGLNAAASAKKVAM